MVLLNLKLLCLSFLKEKNIDYYYDEPYAVISCLKCSKELKLDTHNGKWSCKNCNSKGNLFDLEELILNGFRSSTIYNPRKEKNKLKQNISKIKEKITDPEIKYKIDEVNEKLEELFTYFTEKEKKSS